MRKSPRASVIVINMNGKHFLDECFSSLANQTYHDFEIILVDNGSNDGSVEYVKNAWPKVSILALEKNYGFGVGNNKGIEIAKGEYIALLNNDTKTDARWLEELIKPMEHDAAIGMCASKMVFADNPDLIDFAGDEMFLAGTTFTYRYYPASHPMVIAPRKCLSACAGAALYRKKMLSEIGAFDEIYSPIYFEDVDLGLRAQYSGYTCRYVPTAMVYHKVSATMNRKSSNYVYLNQRNIEILLLKNMPFSAYLLYLPFRILLTCLIIIRYIPQGKAIAIIKAKMDFIRMIKKIITHRSALLKLQKVPSNQIIARFKKGWFIYRLKYFLKIPF